MPPAGEASRHLSWPRTLLWKIHTKKCVYGKGHLLSCCSVAIFHSGGIVVISASYEELPDITFCLIQKIITWL